MTARAGDAFDDALAVANNQAVTARRPTTAARTGAARTGGAPDHGTADAMTATGGGLDVAADAGAPDAAAREDGTRNAGGARETGETGETGEDHARPSRPAAGAADSPPSGHPAPGDRSPAGDRPGPTNGPTNGPIGPTDRPSGSHAAPGRQPTPEGAAGAAGAATRSSARDRATALRWEEARAIARRAARPPAPVTLPLERAHQQVIAAPLPALTDLPSFDTSAMDGWAVAGPGPWELTDTATTDNGTPVGILAGDAEPAPLADGRAVPIATGARIPRGATAVLRSEDGEVNHGGTRLHAHQQPPPGKDIRPRGQECRSGDQLLPAATPVTPAVLGLAAGAGYDELTVTPRPRAEVLVLGDELLHRGRPRDGRIRDALGPMIAPWLDALGAHTLVTRRLGDDAEALWEAVSTSTADLIVTTGGTASGPVDHVHPTLRRIGARLLVNGVAVRPGHPMLLAELPSGKHLVGLPGNPLAAVSGLFTLAEPLVRALGNRPGPAPIAAALTADVPGHPRDTRLIPVTSAVGQGTDSTGMVVRPLRYAGPAMLRGIATAIAMAVIPPGGVTRGTEVQLLPLPWA